MRTVLFVCTGNTCRSPMAEGVARHLQATGVLPADLFFASAGTSAYDGDPTSEATREFLRGLGIESEGAAKRLTAAMVEKADLVLTMTRSHVAAARCLVPGDVASAEKIQPLDPSQDIPDPIGGTQAIYDAVGERLLELIPKRLQEMLTP